MPKNDKLQEGRARALLAKNIIYKNQLMTKKEWLDRLVVEGGSLYTDRHSKHVFNRTKFNRLEGQAQRDYVKKLEEKDPYSVVVNETIYSLTQTEAAYFLSVGGKRGMD